jgi:soluble lytic murein transglycosylase-like protein
VVVAAAVTVLGLAALPAQAAPLQALSPHDAALYAAAFDAAERGDVAAADQAVAQVSDPCLAGKVQYLELTRAKARTATYEELSSWLQSFGDMPGADQVYALALRRRPADASPPAPISTPVDPGDGPIRAHAAPQSRAAREAYFNGEVGRALELARASGDAWIAGLAAYRLGDYAGALISFESLAANAAEEDGMRAAGGVWAAKAAAAAGMPERVTPLLKIAAAAPDTFYGMIARRKLELADDPLGRMIDAATSGPPLPTATAVPLKASYSLSKAGTALDQLVSANARARRAVALMQLSRPADAAAELKAGFAEAPDDATRALWLGLTFELNAQPASGEIVLRAAQAAQPRAAYPTPALAPAGGFTVDKALVYAVVWQESRFNSLAVSPVGAVGLMQLMPPSAASVSGDPTLADDPITLFDAGKNLELGQAYLNWLQANAGGYDLLRTIAAYNGGPSTLARTEAMLGPNADSLMVIESVPFAETRAYVRKVAAAYWAYRRQFGAPTRTLDAVAADAPLIDTRLDSSAPLEHSQPLSGPAREAMEILLGRSG